MEHIGELIIGASAMIQAFNLFLSGYLLTRVDRADANLIEHERNCNK
jgi:hypothetical protein